jgi:hypothetical protein
MENIGGGEEEARSGGSCSAREAMATPTTRFPPVRDDDDGADKEEEEEDEDDAKFAMFLDGLRREVAGDHAEVSFFFSRTFKGGRGDGRSESGARNVASNGSDILLSNGSRPFSYLSKRGSLTRMRISKFLPPISAVFIFRRATGSCGADFNPSSVDRPTSGCPSTPPPPPSARRNRIAAIATSRAGATG